MASLPRFPRTNFGFEVFLQMTDGKVTRLVLLLQTAHHYAAFKRTCNQSGRRHLQQVLLCSQSACKSRLFPDQWLA